MTRWLVALLAAGLAAAPTRAGDLPPDWAYKPVSKPAVPVVRGKAAVRTPVDAFLLAKLEARGLSFAAPADERTLLRRVTFDLTGLPPTPEQVEAFLADAAPDAFEKVVDRLLASPQYGERQALGWLDLARYAESDGFKADDARPEAWRYRDYVIRAFNADTPFDRFVKEQLAADELFPCDLAAAPATGFLRHYPSEYNAVDVELKRQDILNDLADTTAAAFLGVTLACAKCHDHKTDPVTQADYYRFQAFFAGFWPVEVPLLPPADRGAREKALAEWEAKTADLRLQLTELEKPVRAKATARERGRFPIEYAGLLDIPAGTRTPLQKQLGVLVERQVYSRNKVTAAQVPAADRAKWESLTKQLAALEKDRPAGVPTAPAMTDVGPVPPVTKLLKRGNWRAPGDELAPGYPSAVDDRDATPKPTAAGTSGRRTALATWIADAKNPLTARVLVNRVWQQHFGTGIVATPSDFGVTGDRPTHSELLDWLATEFIRNGWSVKKLHRLIVTSAAYRQSSGNAESNTAVFGFHIPPSAFRIPLSEDDALLDHFPRRRLDGEALRDAILMTAGVLNPKAGGPGVYPDLPAEIKAASWKVSADPAERNRRSVYVAVKRNLRYPFFSLFDSPDRTETCARRYVTTTAPQALTLLNDALVLGHAKTFAARVLTDAGTDPDRVIDRAFALALCHPPTSEERATMRAFLAAHSGPFPDAAADLCHALLNLNEFLYVD